MDNHLKNIQNLTKLMDNQFSILGIRFGIDPLLGLVPVVGDILPTAISLYIVWYSKKLGVATPVLARMLLNIGVDFGIGLIPVLGDAADFAVKSNTKNFELLQKHMRSGKVLEGEIVS